MRQADLLEQGMFSGMLDVKKCNAHLQQMKRRGGLMRPMDEHFAGYWQGYLRSMQDHAVALDRMLGDGKTTLRDSIMLKLRRKVKEALTRIYGKPLVPEIKQINIIDLLKSQ